jgi:hypothetical protein
VRISDWAKHFGITVEPAQAEPGETVYRVRDIFTTRDGSWEPSDKPGSIPAWARDAYLKYPKHAQYFDDAGADHHLFGAAMGDAGNLQPFGTIRFYTYTDNGNQSTQRVKHSGWGNIPIFGHSETPGPWAWHPTNGGKKADVVKGGGLPGGWHVSFFCVWEAVEEPAIVAPPIDPVPPTPVEPLTLESLAARVLALEKRLNAMEGD